MIAIAAKTALSVQTMFAMSVSVMSQTASEIRVRHAYDHCDLFAAFGVGLALGFLIGLTISLIVIL